MSHVKETYFMRSLAYLRASAAIHKLFHDITDAEVRGVIIEMAAELEYKSKSWQLKAESLLEITPDVAVESPHHPRSAPILPPSNDHEEEHSPDTLPSQKVAGAK